MSQKVSFQRQNRRVIPGNMFLSLVENITFSFIPLKAKWTSNIWEYVLDFFKYVTFCCTMLFLKNCSVRFYIVGSEKF